MKFYQNLFYSVRKSKLVLFFIIYLRYLLGGAYIYAGFGKALGHRFVNVKFIHTPYGAFFESLYQTGIWWQFLGWGQLITGLLVMTQRFATLGAVMYLPISVNIFVITISMNFGGTPLITSLMLVGNLLLLYWDWAKIKYLFYSNRSYQGVISSEKGEIESSSYWEWLGLALALTCVLFHQEVIWWFVLCTLEGLLALLLFFVFIKK